MTDVAALEAWTERNRSAARSYAAYPTVTGHASSPACANDCGYGTRTAGQVCQRCRQAEKRNTTMVRHLIHTPTIPATSNRRDEPPPPPCATDDEHGAPNWLKFDRVLDRQRPHDADVEACRAICATCPLAVKAACLRDNRDQPGVIAGLTLRERVPLLPPTVTVACGKPHGCAQHARHGERSCDPCKAARAADKRRQRQRSTAGGFCSEARLEAAHEAREARLDNLRDLIAGGATMGEVLDRLGMTRRALWKWCDRNGHMVEWVRLSPPVPAAIGLRARHNKGRAAV
jgi:hypothetical protein